MPRFTNAYEKQLVEEVEAYLEGYTSAQREAAKRAHPSSYIADEEVQPYGEHPDLPEV